MSMTADEIVSILSPVIGRGLAESAVIMQCRKLGILPEDLSEENIGEFFRHFRNMMEIFAGKQVADEIMMKIQQIVEKKC